MILKKTKLALGIASVTLAMAGALIAPQALADTHTDKQIQALQAQINQLKAQINTMATVQDPKVQELDDWMASVKSQPIKPETKNNMVFFRGGYARNDHSREGSILTDANALNEGTGGNVGGLGVTTSQLTGNSPNGNNDGWYFGAGLDFNVSDNLFGLIDNTALLGEITIGYKEFSQKDINRAPLGTAANDSATGATGTGSVPAGVCGGASGNTAGLVSNGQGPYGSCSSNIAVTQITITASPKIKFMADSDFSPWIIPVGFGLHVISPPSDGVTYIAPGVMFAGGADYRLWENIYFGVDGRYHLVSNTVADVDLDGWEVGGYLGFGF